MGFFNDLGKTFSDIKEFGDELMAIKDDVMSSVQDAGDSAKGILDDIKGTSSAAGPADDQQSKDSDTQL